MNTPEGKIFRFVRPVAPEIFDRVAFEKELKGNFASRGPSLRRGAHQKPQTRSRGRGGVRARVESEGTLLALARLCSLGTALVMPYGAARLNGKIAS